MAGYGSAGHLSRRLPTWMDALQWILISTIVASMLAIGWSLPVAALVEAFRVHAGQAGWGTACTFVALYVVFTAFLIPVWPMPFVAGALFGTTWGTLLASAGCVTASAVTFFLARIVRRTSLRQYLESSPRVKAFEKTVDEASWKIVAAVRISHFMTFGMQNYAFGLTSIGFRTFVFTTWAVTLPGTFLQAYLGDLGFTSVDAWQSQTMEGWQTWAMRLGGLCLIAIGVGYIAHRVRAVYRDAIQMQLEQQLQVEQTVNAERHGWTWKLGVLGVVAASLVLLASAAVLNRQALRNLVEQRLSMETTRR